MFFSFSKELVFFFIYNRDLIRPCWRPVSYKPLCLSFPVLEHSNLSTVLQRYKRLWCRRWLIFVISFWSTFMISEWKQFSEKCCIISLVFSWFVQLLSEAETHQLYRVQTIFRSGLILAFEFGRCAGFACACHVALGGLVTPTAHTLCHKQMNQTSGDKQAHGDAVTVKKNKAKHNNKSDAGWHIVVPWNVVRLHF